MSAIVDLIEEINELKNRLKLVGKIEGIVCENEDPEKKGRIKVHIEEWDTKSKPFITTWCKPSVPYAGDNFGEYFIPELDSAVYVEFGNQNINNPIWTSQLWQTQNIPSEINFTVGNFIKIIKTKGGHQILFDDSSENGNLSVIDKNGNKLVFNENIVLEHNNGDKIEFTESGTTIEDRKGNKIEMNQDGINLSAIKDIKLSGTSKLIIGSVPFPISGLCVLTNCIFSGVPHTTHIMDNI